MGIIVEDVERTALSLGFGILFAMIPTLYLAAEDARRVNAKIRHALLSDSKSQLEPGSGGR
ncbi:MAG: hypothetical protein C4532_16915 [Candidatus Abyssobacteria bacterium SURF_17]|jgi:ABC-type uncharacterized transport system permease subunit|uniref:Uncharacterized protein n=1 Tax=Candidatus Abyssobacteria bacterium SURF_17 TaxID=2093361 RepID=A0A419ER79_9BACT|nr:MAG: hypothetical protein C4532_16915 [Candidatus Abyssubacteria bacterium SURF_17]